jgi:hypothetical protein
MPKLLQADLFYKDHRSDKEYHLQFNSVVVRGRVTKYTVTFPFGPRGKALTHVDKTRGATNYSNAYAIYLKTKNEKLAKGYKPIDQEDELVNKFKAAVVSPWWYGDSEWKEIAKVAREYFEELV